MDAAVATILMMIYAVSLRGFLFDIKFGKLRDTLKKKGKLLEIFLTCTFCNGFWSGVFVYLVILREFDLELLFFSVTVGFVSFMIDVVTRIYRDE